MRKAYRKPSIVSERSFETSALSCAKSTTGENIHIGPGSTYLTGHSAGSVSYSHTPGTSGPWLHFNSGYSSVSTAICQLAYLAS
ncbi:hypothetical protein JXA88_18465 [Candidatus Fermentibacteria bacterium]|nr:hypothetical protein [Candidatus Fermentibacteria bacterium]